MGGTSRNALIAFGLEKSRLPDANAKVRVLNGLHAKIFLGERRAVIGSANASINALGGNGRTPCLEEAGVLIDRLEDGEAYLQLEKIYKKYQNKSQPIGPEDFDRAVHLAATAASRDHDTYTGSNHPSIFGSLLERPQRFSQTAFICADRNFETNTDEQEANEAYEKVVGEPPKSHGRSIICQFSDELGDEEKLRRANEIVMFWFGSSSGIFAYHDVVRIEHHDGSISYFGRRSWPKVRQLLGMSSVKLTELWQQDKDQALKIAQSGGDDEDDRFVVLKSEDLYEILERMPTTDGA